MTEVTKEMINVGHTHLAGDGDLASLYLAMREKDPEFLRMRNDLKMLDGACLSSLKYMTELAEAVEIMKPFAIKDDAIDRWFGVEYTHDNSSLFSINGERIEVRHIRNARAFVEKHSKGGDAK